MTGPSIAADTVLPFISIAEVLEKSFLSSADWIFHFETESFIADTQTLRSHYPWWSGTKIPVLFYLYQGQHFNSTSFSKESICLFFSSVKFSFVKRFIMTLEQTSETKTDKSGAKVTTKRTVKTFFAKGAQETTTPWGVTLKPVPRKKIVEEIIKNDSKPNERPSPSRPLPKLNTSKVRGWFIDIYR